MYASLYLSMYVQLLRRFSEIKFSNMSTMALSQINIPRQIEIAAFIYLFICTLFIVDNH